MRPPRVLRKKFYGSPSASVIGFAVARYQDIVNTIHQFGIIKKVYQYDGSIIIIKISEYTDEIIIFGFSLELESGVITSGFLNTSLDISYEPRTLYPSPNQPLEQYPNKLSSGGSVKETEESHDGRESEAVPDGTLSLKKKAALEYWGPGSFTGLMRKLMQAQYGKPLKGSMKPLEVDMETDLGGVVTGASVSLSGVQVGHNSVLFRNNNYDYWLLTMGNSSLSYRKLKFNSSAKKLIRWIIDVGGSTELSIEQAEAFVLSGLKGFEDPVTLDYELTVEGSPLYYSWHANNDGSELSIVTIKNNVTVLVARLYRIDVTETDGVLEINCVLEETSNFNYQKLRVLFWIPAEIGTAAFEPIDPGSILGTNVPIYCYYDGNNARQVARFNIETIGSSTQLLSESPWVEAVCFGIPQTPGQPQYGPGWCGDTSNDSYSAIAANLTTKYTISVAGVTVEGLSKTGLIQYSFSFSNSPNGNQNNYEGAPLSGYCGTPFTVATDSIRDQLSDTQYQEISDTGSGAGSRTVTGSAFLLIPKSDCDAVYIGKKEILSGGTRTTRTWTRNEAPYQFVGYKKISSSPDVYSPTGEDKYTLMYTVAGGTCGGNGVDVTVNLVTTVSSSPAENLSKFYFSGKNGVEFISSGAGQYTELGEFPPVGNILERSFYALQSEGELGEWRITSGNYDFGFTEGGYAHDVDVGQRFVGWV